MSNLGLNHFHDDDDALLLIFSGAITAIAKRPGDEKCLLRPKDKIIPDKNKIF